MSAVVAPGFTASMESYSHLSAIVVVLALLCGGRSADAIRPVVAGLEPIPGQRGEVDDDDLARADDAV